MRKYLLKFMPTYFYLLPSCVIYDATGKRSLEIKNGNYGIMIWDGDYVVAETVKNTTADASKPIANKYFRGHKLFANKSTSGVGYYTYDAHGSVVGMSNESYVYDAFGNQITGTTSYNPFRYCGEYMEPDTGLIYLRNRYYDPSVGRFITEDPVKDGLNWYVYCGNNPILYVDPSGLDSWVFYGFDQRESVKAIEEQLLEANPNSPVHVVCVQNADDFHSGWNAMGIVDGQNVSIDTVVINMHGMVENYETGMITPSPGTFGGGKSIDMNMLESKNIDTMVLLSCNAGLIDIKSNIATQMLNKNDISYLIAADGFVVTNDDSGLFDSAIDALERRSPDPERAGTGFCLYRNIGGTIDITKNLTEDGKSSSVINLMRTARKVAMQNTLLWDVLKGNFPKATASDFVNMAIRNPNSINDMVKSLESYR